MSCVYWEPKSRTRSVWCDTIARAQGRCQGSSSAVGRRNYIVVLHRRNPISGVSAVLIALATTALSGQQPNRKPEPYVAPLLPAEQAWLVTLPAPPSAGGAMDAHHVYIPL